MNDETQWYDTYMPKNYDTILSLRELGLTFIPESIATHLQHVTVLDLSFNNLTNIPASIGKCTNLQELWINNNQLDLLPDLSQLSLTRLNVSHNKLTTLSNINTLILDASYNELTTIFNLGYMTSILNLDHNNLTTLELNTPHLQILNICNNFINEPELISNQFSHPLSEFWY